MYQTKKNIKEYERAIQFVRENRKNFIILSCQYNNNFKLFPALVSFAAFLRGRKSIFHTALIVNSGNKVYSLEITPKRLALANFKENYFTPNFEGILNAQVVKGDKTKEDEQKIYKYINNNVLNNRYGKIKAMRSWWKLWEQKDDDKTIYCTDKVLDILEKFGGHKIFSNNAEVTPASLYHKLLDDYRFTNKYCTKIQQLNNCSL